MDEKYKIFSEINENMRYYGGLRFKQLTLLLAATGVLLGVQFEKITLINLINFKWLISSIGFVLTGVFWLMEKRSYDAYWHFRDRAKELEEDFKFKIFTTFRPKKIGATYAVNILHGGLLIMWIIFLMNELMGKGGSIMDISEFFRDYGTMISTLALILTLVVIICYTYETRKLRKETVKQTELSLRPFIIVSIFKDEAGLSERLVYKNIGHSPAIDVETEPFEAKGFMLNFNKYGLMELDEKRDLNPRGEGKATPNDVIAKAVRTPGFTPKALAERDSKLEIILNIHYKNIENVFYQTQAKISQKGIEILKTGKI